MTYDPIDIISAVTAASGKEKQRILRQYNDEFLLQIFKYVYDPDLKYYMIIDLDTELTPYKEGEGADLCYIAYSNILNDLSSRELSGLEATRVVMQYMSNLAPEEANLFAKIINKDLRMGVGIKTIQKLFPDLIKNKPSAQLVKGFNEKKVQYPCLVSPKYDGVRGLWDGQFKTRQGKVIKGLDHIERQLSAMFPTGGIILDGELLVRGLDFDKASGLIRNDQQVPDAYYMVFDVPSMDDSLRNRLLWLHSNLYMAYCIYLAAHTMANNNDDILNYYAQCINKDLEGIVIKNPNEKYKEGRSWDWMRLVPAHTADCKVTGVFEGQGKYKDTLGGIIVDYQGHEVKVGSGFSDEERDLIWSKSEEYVLDAIAECEYKEKTKAGAMRQPRFKRWRWDKEEVD